MQSTCTIVILTTLSNSHEVHLLHRSGVSFRYFQGDTVTYEPVTGENIVCRALALHKIAKVKLYQDATRIYTGQFRVFVPGVVSLVTLKSRLNGSARVVVATLLHNKVAGFKHIARGGARMRRPARQPARCAATSINIPLQFLIFQWLISKPLSGYPPAHLTSSRRSWYRVQVPVSLAHS